MIIVFDDRINTNSLNHKTDGIATSWNNVSRMVLDLISMDDGGTDLQFDTSISGEDVVDFITIGLLVFTLGDQNIIAGNYEVELTAVDSSGNKTQLIHPNGEFLIFNFSSTKTIA